MDEVLEKLETTVISHDNKEDGKTAFESLYKNWGRLGNQEERRKEILETQKGNRNERVDKFRGVLELVNAVEEENIFRSYNKTYYRPSIYVAGFNKSSLTYRNVLMMSEWLVEKPDDFNENWCVVACPSGVRMLVVASRGTTKCYTKYGQFRFECRTALPGGNPSEPKLKHHCCVLDCFYQEKNNTMYVLDLLAWNNQTMTDGEAEFRHYWIKTQFAEIPELKYVNKKNKVVFTVLPMVPCTPESLNQFMNTFPPFECNFPPMDGLLFYHNKAHYISGETPLVGWLYPYMVQEVLGSDVTVHPTLNEKPPNYTNQAEFIQKFEAKNAKKKGRSRRGSCSSNMDTTEIKSESRLSKESDDHSEDKSKTGNMEFTETIKESVEEKTSVEDYAKTDSEVKPKSESMEAEEISNKPAEDMESDSKAADSNN